MNPENTQPTRPPGWRGMPYYSVRRKIWDVVGGGVYSLQSPEHIAILGTDIILLAGEEGCPLLPEEHRGKGWAWYGSCTMLDYLNVPYGAHTPIPDRAMQDVLTWALDNGYVYHEDASAVKNAIRNSKPKLPNREDLYEVVIERSKQLKEQSDLAATMAHDARPRLMPDGYATHWEYCEHDRTDSAGNGATLETFCCDCGSAFVRDKWEPPEDAAPPRSLDVKISIEHDKRPRLMPDGDGSIRADYVEPVEESALAPNYKGWGMVEREPVEKLLREAGPGKSRPEPLQMRNALRVAMNAAQRIKDHEAERLIQAALDYVRRRCEVRE